MANLQHSLTRIYIDFVTMEHIDSYIVDPIIIVDGREFFYCRIPNTVP